MRSISFAKSAFLAVALLNASAAIAQKTYRCGNTFQSYPCAVPNAAASATSASAGKTDNKAKTPEATPEERKAEADKQAQLAEAKKQEDAAKAKRMRCDKVRNDMDYNAAQQKAAVSSTTMERLKTERKQIELDMKKETC